MTRKTLVLFSLSLFAISLLAVSAFGASAAKVNQVPTEALGLIPLSEYVAPPIVGGEDYQSSGSKYSGNYTSLGVPTFGADYVYTAHTVGTTFYDYQANGSMGRQIVVGSDGRVHFVWMNDEDAHPGGADRNVNYRSWLAGTFTLEKDLKGEGAGYTSIDIYNNKACPTYHQGGDSWAAIQLTVAGAVFTDVKVPQANCQGIVTLGGTEADYLWPVIDIQVGATGDTIVHMLATEAAGTGEIQSLVYWRGTGTPYTTWDDPTCGEFVDSCNDISAVVRSAKDGNGSGKVAIVYTRPRNFDGVNTGQLDNDVAYHVSDDYGQSWNGLQYAVQYADDDLERAYTDVSALWDSRDCLHIVWQAAYFNDAEGTVHLQWANLYHWAGECSDITTPAIALVESAYNAQNCLPGAWNRNISKMNISECIFVSDAGPPEVIDTNLYITYTYFRGDADGDPEVEDCSAALWSNGEIYAQTSSTWGDTWGAPLNLTNTKSPGCTAGNCESEHWSSSAQYVTDSLRLSFIADIDAGGIVQTEGTWQNNPVMFMSVPCFEMEEYVSLSSLPGEFCYPFGGNPSGNYTREFTLTNSGNITASYTITPSGGWLSTDDPGSGSIAVGPANALDFTLTVVAPATEGLYSGNITFNYNDGTGPATRVIGVEFYSFNGFAAPEDAAIRTGLSRLNVANLGRVGHQDDGNMMSYFVAGEEPLNFLYDGSVIIGSASDDTWASWIIFDQGVYCGGTAPGPNEDHGKLWPLTPIIHDSTTYDDYRYAEGSGCNDDSTIAFDCKYYAPKHPANANFYIGRFDFYAGPLFTADIENVFLAFSIDWDIQSDTSYDNSSGVDETLQLVYQKGEYTGSVENNDNLFGGMSYFGDDGVDALGGIALQNDQYVHPHGDFPVDTLNDLCLTHTGWTASHVDSLEDLSTIIFAKRGLTVTASSEHSFCIIFAGSNNSDLKNINHLKAQIPKARTFICAHVASDYQDCQFLPCLVGDADGNGIVEISDAVYLIAFVFIPGSPAPVPNPISSGDADCNTIVEISDAVYIIAFVFIPGSPTPGDPDNDGNPDCDCVYQP